MFGKVHKVMNKSIQPAIWTESEAVALVLAGGENLENDMMRFGMNNIWCDMVCDLGRMYSIWLSLYQDLWISRSCCSTRNTPDQISNSSFPSHEFHLFKVFMPSWPVTHDKSLNRLTLCQTASAKRDSLQKGLHRFTLYFIGFISSSIHLASDHALS